MEKAILKTLIYADIFGYPLTIYEIHKWLIGKKAALRQVEKGLERLAKKLKVKSRAGYYFLPKRDSIFQRRKRNKKQVKRFLQRAKFAAYLLKIVPWIKLVGISGGLAMENVSKKDDIDLFLITEKNRIWISRLLAIFLLNFFRRKVSDKKRDSAGKICLNLVLDEDNLGQDNKDFYTAHEVLQMRVLWEKNGIYHKFLLDNEWAFKALPNWIGNFQRVASSRHYVARVKQKNKNIHTTYYILHTTILDYLENLARKFQLMVMQKPQGSERVQEGALYFHPQDYREITLKTYNRRRRPIDK